MNLKLRFQNKTTLTAIIFVLIAIVYKILGFFGITPDVEMGEVKELAEMLIFLLALVGIVTDPTTEGISDSERAMCYQKPFSDYAHDEDEDEEDTLQ